MADSAELKFLKLLTLSIISLKRKIPKWYKSFHPSLSIASLGHECDAIRNHVRCADRKSYVYVKWGWMNGTVRKLLHIRECEVYIWYVVWIFHACACVCVCECVSNCTEIGLYAFPYFSSKFDFMEYAIFITYSRLLNCVWSTYLRFVSVLHENRLGVVHWTFVQDCLPYDSI